jgi:hypothetical protein
LSLARFIEGLIGMIPILYHGPFFTVYSYGLMVALGFILATAGLVRQARREGLDSGRVYDFCFVLLIAGILGARIFYVVLNWSDFNDRLLDIVKINQGGLVWFGGGFSRGRPFYPSSTMVVCPDGRSYGALDRFGAGGRPGGVFFERLLLRVQDASRIVFSRSGRLLFSVSDR